MSHTLGLTVSSHSSPLQYPQKKTPNRAPPSPPLSARSSSFEQKNGSCLSSSSRSALTIPIPSPSHAPPKRLSNSFRHRNSFFGGSSSDSSQTAPRTILSARSSTKGSAKKKKNMENYDDNFILCRSVFLCVKETEKDHINAMFAFYPADGLFRSLLRHEISCEKDFNVVLRSHSPATVCLQLLLQRAGKDFLARPLRSFLKEVGKAKRPEGEIFSLTDHIGAVQSAVQAFLLPFEIPEYMCTLSYIASDLVRMSYDQEDEKTHFWAVSNCVFFYFLVPGVIDPVKESILKTTKGQEAAFVALGKFLLKLCNGVRYPDSPANAPLNDLLDIFHPFYVGFCKAIIKRGKNKKIPNTDVSNESLLLLKNHLRTNATEILENSHSYSLLHQLILQIEDRIDVEEVSEATPQASIPTKRPKSIIGGGGDPFFSLQFLLSLDGKESARDSLSLSPEKKGKGKLSNSYDTSISSQTSSTEDLRLMSFQRESSEGETEFSTIFTDQILLSFFKTFLGGMEEGKPLSLLHFTTEGSSLVEKIESVKKWDDGKRKEIKNDIERLGKMLVGVTSMEDVIAEAPTLVILIDRMGSVMKDDLFQEMLALFKVIEKEIAFVLSDLYFPIFLKSRYYSRYKARIS